MSELPDHVADALADYAAVRFLGEITAVEYMRDEVVGQMMSAAAAAALLNPISINLFVACKAVLDLKELHP